MSKHGKRPNSITSRTRSTIRLEAKHELLLVLCLASMLIVVIYVWPQSVARVALGLFYSLVLPGYALLVALLPRRDDLSGVERLVLSFALSIVVMILLGLLLNYTPWGIRLESILVLVTPFILLCSGVGYYRRIRLPAEERFAFHLQFDLSRWQRMAQLDKLLSALLVLSVIAAVGTLVYAVAKPKTGERFTEFYVLGTAGTAAGYPEKIAPGEPVDLIIGVTNHEQGDVQYRIKRAGPSGTEQVADIQLSNEQTWERSYSFTLTQSGENEKVEFLLYKADEQEPYRSVHLWITVRENQ